MEEQRLRIQQAKIDGARLQINQAREVRAGLEQELESEEAGRRQASEGQAKQWREAAFRTHICLANLRAKEQEVAQLRTALSRPASLAEVWDGMVKKLQNELDLANVEAAEAKRELDQVTAECSKAEVELANVEDRESVREELLRIASRASDSAKALQAGSGTSSRCGTASQSREPSVRRTPGVAADRSRLGLEALASHPAPGAAGLGSLDQALASRPAPAAAGLGLRPDRGEARPAAQPPALGAGPALRSDRSVLEEAQRVLEKMEMLNSKRVPAAGVSMANSTTLRPLA